MYRNLKAYKGWRFDRIDPAFQYKEIASRIVMAFKVHIQDNFVLL